MPGYEAYQAELAAKKARAQALLEEELAVSWTAVLAPPRIGMPGYEVYQAELAALKASAQALLKEESAASWTAELAPMRQGAGVSLNDFVDVPFVDVPKVRDTEDGGDVDFTAEKQRMRRVALIGELEPADVSYSAEKQRMRRVAGLVELGPVVVFQTVVQTVEKQRMRRVAGSGQLEPAGVSYTAEKQRMRRVAGSGQLEPAGVSYTAEKQRMRRVAGFGQLEPAGVSYTATQTRPRQAAGLSSTQSSAETLNRLRAERLGRDAAKEAIHNVADAIAVQVRPDKVQIQALANALKAIGLEEFADELDRTEPRLIIDYWFPRLWTRVVDHQLTRSIEGLDATRGERELFSDVRELLREREALTRDRETHQRLEELLDAAEVAGTDSQAFQEFQVEWIQVRMRRAIGLARQDRERTGIVSPTVRQRLIQLHGELGALRATDS